MKSRRLLALVLALLLALAVVPMAAAGPSSTKQPLSEGQWIGIGFAKGAFEADAPGVYVLWAGAVSAIPEFTIAGGQASGTWTFIGAATQYVEGEGTEAEGDLEYSGTGQVSGTPSQLVLDAEVTTTGTVTATAPGVGQVSFPIDNTNPIPTLTMDVFEVCDDAYGDWQYVVSNAFEDAGFAEVGGIAADGIFAAFNVEEGGFSELSAAGLAEAGYTVDPQYIAEYPEVPEFVWLMRALLNDFADLTSRFPDWTYAEVAFTIDQANAAINELRNLNYCEREILGEENVERWINILTEVVHQLTAGLADLNLFSTSEEVQSFRQTEVTPPSLAWQLLVQMAARTGVIGPGAIDQERAAHSEQQLIDLGSEILSRSTGDDGGLVADEHVLRVLATGAAMGWTFDVESNEIDARTAFAEVVGG